MPQNPTQLRFWPMVLMVVALAAAQFAHAGEPSQELRCIGAYRSQGIGTPSDVAVSNSGPAEQYLVIENERLVIQDSNERDLEYALCKTTDTQLHFSNQCGLTPEKFITGWQAIGKWITTPKGPARRPKVLPLSVDHVAVNRPSMVIQWTHLTGTAQTSNQKGGSALVYFVGSEFEGKCVPAQMVL